MRLIFAALMALPFLGCASTDLGGITLPGQSETAQRESIARVLEELHDGVNGRKIYKVMAVISPVYQDDAGRNREQVQQLTKEFFGQHRRVRVTRTNPRLQLSGDEAVAIESIGLIAEPLEMEQADLNWIGEIKILLRRSSGGSWEIERISQVQ